MRTGHVWSEGHSPFLHSPSAIAPAPPNNECGVSGLPTWDGGDAESGRADVTGWVHEQEPGRRLALLALKLAY
jgi:hypothetical protein